MTIELVGSTGQPIKATQALDKPNVFICMFGYKSVAPATSYALVREMRQMDQLGINFLYHAVEGDALISRSRSKALSMFLDIPDLDVCVMVDHDIVWEPGAIAALALKAHEHKACVAGLYSCRGRGNGFASRLLNSNIMLKTQEDKLHDAEFLATGFLAIPRVVAQEVLKAGKSTTISNLALHPCLYLDSSIFYGFFRCIEVPTTMKFDWKSPEGKKLDNLQPLHEYLSEDWAFSWRCKQANPDRPLYVWTLPWLEHLGVHGYTVLDAGKQK